MRQRIREGLRFVGLQLAVAAGAVHLVWGVPRLAAYLSVGRLPDPRPLLFVVSAAVVFAAVVAVILDVQPRRAMGTLVLIMAVYLVGFAWWHLGSHGGFWPGLRPITHDVDPAVVYLEHLAKDPVAIVATVAEIGTILALGAVLADGGR